MSGFCRWYGKDMEDVTEHEQEQCEENGQDCRECPDLVIKEQEAAGHERYNTARERVFTVSVLNGERFEFDDLIRTPMRNLQEFLEDDVPDIYDVTQPSVLACIGEKGIRRATVIKDCAYTITTRQDRTPAQVIDRGDGRYRYLTERECWRLMGYTDEDFDRAKAVQERNGKYYKALYDQAGNSIAVPIFESIFRKIILQEVA